MNDADQSNMGDQGSGHHSGDQGIGEALERLAKTLDDRPGAAPSRDEIWALAAGELTPDRAAAVLRGVTGNRSALAELATAELALQAAEATPLAAREATARQALAAARAPAARAPRLFRSTLARVAALAALFLVVLWWWHRAGAVEPPSWRHLIETTSQLRGGDPESAVRILFRVELSVPVESRAALVSVGRNAEGEMRAAVQLPAVPAAQLRPAFVGWSEGRVLPGQHTLPPATVGAYQIEVRGPAVLFLLTAPLSAVLDHDTAQQLRARIEAGCQSGLTPAVLDRIAAALGESGVQARWRSLWP